MNRPWRLNLPCEIEVRTASTFEPSSFSTARLMSTLVAPAATSNTTVRPASRSSVVFSVMSGRRMISVSFITCLCQGTREKGQGIKGVPCPLSLPQRLLQLLNRRARRDDLRRVHDVAGGDAIGRHQRQAGNVARTEDEVLLRRDVDDERL